MKIQTLINRIMLYNTIKHLSSLVLTSCNRHDSINSNDLNKPYLYSIQEYEWQTKPYRQ